MTRQYKLTDDEALLLDGKVNDEAQKQIDWIKQIRIFSDIGNPFAAEVVAVALSHGYLKVSGRQLSKCRTCDRTSRWTEPKRRNARSQQVYLSGISYNDGFVIVQDYSEYGICNECYAITGPLIRQYIIERNLPIDLRTDATKWAREEKRTCRQCQRAIWEFDMGVERTLMGDGWFYSKCPYCCATGGFLASHGVTGEWRCVPVAELKKHGNLWLRSANPAWFGSPYMNDAGSELSA